LELRDLAVERDERLLFTGMNLAFNAGDIIQILGPNGAGKTTLLRALAQLNTDYQGEVRYLGQALADCAWDYACDCLYLGHLAGIKKSLSPRENLQWYSAQVGSRMPIDEALERVGLKGYEDTHCYQLSAGQLRRVALARLHLSNARIWILDEPFTAIDKLGVKALETLIIEQSARGGLVLLTSHQDLNLDSLKMVNLLDYLPGKALQAASVGVGVSYP
jgi:heme exporter protein A